jgi:hypothetical protein
MVCNITWSQGQDQQDEGICICDFIQIINYYFLLAFQYWEYIHKAINVSPHGMKRLCCTTYCFTGFSATASSLISFHCSSFHSCFLFSYPTTLLTACYPQSTFTSHWSLMLLSSCLLPTLILYRHVQDEQHLPFTVVWAFYMPIPDPNVLHVPCCAVSC